MEATMQHQNEQRLEFVVRDATIKTYANDEMVHVIPCRNTESIEAPLRSDVRTYQMAVRHRSADLLGLYDIRGNLSCSSDEEWSSVPVPAVTTSPNSIPRSAHGQNTTNNSVFMIPNDHGSISSPH